MLASRKFKSKRGFTLIELLMVLAIMGVVLGIAALGTFSVLQASSLMVATSELSTLTNLTRSTAVGNGTLARLCIITHNPNSPTDDYATLSIWKYDRSSSKWVQETKWQRLPPGIIIDPANNTGATLNTSKNIGATLYDPSSTTGSPSITPTAQGNTVTCTYLEFDATGGLSDQAAGTLGFSLVEGLYDGSANTTNYTHKIAGANTPASYAVISVNSLTGRVKVTRN